MTRGRKPKYQPDDIEREVDERLRQYEQIAAEDDPDMKQAKALNYAFDLLFGRSDE